MEAQALALDSAEPEIKAFHIANGIEPMTPSIGFKFVTSPPPVVKRSGAVSPAILAIPKIIAVISRS